MIRGGYSDKGVGDSVVTLLLVSDYLAHELIEFITHLVYSGDLAAMFKIVLATLFCNIGQHLLQLHSHRSISVPYISSDFYFQPIYFMF